MTATNLLIGVLGFGLVIWRQLIRPAYLAVTFAVQPMVVIARSQRVPISSQNEVTGLA